MNPHLSSDQVSRWLLRERTAAEVEHVRACPLCQAEVTRLAGALAQFRSTVREWAGAPPPSRQIQPAPYGRRWALAALIVIAALFPIYRDVAKRRQTAAARADAILLEQVDASVSRAIARPMEPLAKLMVWDYSRGNEENR